MTKEQALEILRECVTSGRAITNGCHINDTEYEVLKMAIKSLEQQPSDDCEYNRGYRDGYDKGNLNGYELRKAEEKTSDDCVSRAEAIKELKESAKHHANDTREEVLLRRDRDIIRALPPVTPTQRWIPVSERLPEVGEKVLCQCQANIYDVLKLTADGWYYDNRHCYMYMSGFVIAWQPLPKPYEEKRGNENGSN